MDPKMEKRRKGPKWEVFRIWWHKANDDGMSGWGKVLEDRVHLFLLDEKAISKTAHDLPKVTQPVRVKTLVSDPPSSTLSISSFEMIGEGTKQEDTWLTRAGRFGGTEKKRNRPGLGFCVCVCDTVGNRAGVYTLLGPHCSRIWFPM